MPLPLVGRREKQVPIVVLHCHADAVLRFHRLRDLQCARRAAGRLDRRGESPLLGLGLTTLAVGVPALKIRNRAGDLSSGR